MDRPANGVACVGIDPRAKRPGSWFWELAVGEGSRGDECEDNKDAGCSEEGGLMCVGILCVSCRSTNAG